MAIIVTIANQKGGVSKTTTAHSLLRALQEKGMRVLGADADGQMDLSWVSQANTDLIGMAEILKGEESDIHEVIQSTPQGDFIAGSEELDILDKGLEDTTKLSKALQQIHGEYDFVIIDTPGNLGDNMISAFSASDYVIIPTTTDAFPIKNISRLFKSIHYTWKHNNPNLKVAGILITRVDERTTLEEDFIRPVEIAAENIDSSVFKTRIREFVDLRRAQGNRISLFDKFPKSKATQDYRNFTEEFIERVSK